MSDRYELDFDRWRLLVDEYVKRMVGVSVDDLPDYPYRDAYEGDQSAVDVAQDILARTERGDI